MKTPRKNPEVFFFCMKAYLTFFVSALLSPLFFMFSVWRASGASLASSQEVDVNGRARLPSDERLWHPGTPWAWTKSSEQERKRSLLNLMLFFFLPRSFSGAIFRVCPFSITWLSHACFIFSFFKIYYFFLFILFFFVSVRTRGLEHEFLMGDE